MAILKFGFDDTSVLLKFETGQKVDGQYGTQYKWSCNEDDIFYATEHLNALLTQTGVKAGTRVKIGKVTSDVDGKEVTRFKVNGKTFNELAEEGISVQPSASSNQAPLHNDSLAGIEKRLTAIEKQLNIGHTSDTKLSSPSINDEDIPF